MFADRTSGSPCGRTSFAYALLDGLHLVGGHSTVGTQGHRTGPRLCGTLRLKLLKISAVILRNTRRVRFLLSSRYPYQHLFFLVAHRLAPG